jgi:predicted nucleic acid-binding protein
MILLDASVLIDALRRPDPRLHQLFITYQAAVCGLTRAEVLCGARSVPHFQNLSAALARFPQISIPETTWDNLGQHLNTLRLRGITVPFPDVLLASVAIVNDIELWTHDAQFTLMQTVLPALRLFQEPP